MRWKILAMFLLSMGFILAGLLIYVAAQPKDFVIPLELPKNNNPYLQQKFIKGSALLNEKELIAVNKEVLKNKDFKKCFVNSLITRERIYITWEAINPENEREVFILVESLSIEKLKLLTEIDSVEFLFAEQQILVKTKPFWALIVAFNLALFFATVLTGFFIARFKGR